MTTPGDDNAVLAAPTALAPGSDAVSIVDRTELYATYRDDVTEMLDGVAPHLFVSGPPGTGKSLLTRQVLDELLDDQRSAVVSCAAADSPYGVAVALANELDPTAVQFADTGYAEATVMAALSERLAETTAAVLVLDDVDALPTVSLLTRIADATMDTSLATICLANDRSVRNGLSYPIRQHLCARELRFERYSRDEIGRIIRARVDAAFRDGVFTPEALDECATLVASAFDGDLGRGIDLLEFVAVVADEDGATRVTIDHVERARDRLESYRIQASLAEASPHRAACLRAVLDRSLDDDEPPRIDALYETYRARCETDAIEPIGERGFHDHLRALREAGLVSVTSHRSGAPGHYYRYHLAAEPAAVRLALAALSEPSADGV